VDNGTETILRLAHPGAQLLIASEGIHQTLSTFIGDGVSKTYKMPYRRGKLDN
jgi:hypothetical protein